MKYRQLPEGTNWIVLLGAGVLAGIGFTMSIFISNQAFANELGLTRDSKIAVLLGSIHAGLIGFIVLFVSCRHSAI